MLCDFGKVAGEQKLRIIKDHRIIWLNIPAMAVYVVNGEQELRDDASAVRELWDGIVAAG